MILKTVGLILCAALTPVEAIRDPFVLEFLDLKDEYSESDLEAALIQRLTDFLLELGDDFAFVGQQRRLRSQDLVRQERCGRGALCAGRAEYQTVVQSCAMIS